MIATCCLLFFRDCVFACDMEIDVAIGTNDVVFFHFRKFYNALVVPPLPLQSQDGHHSGWEGSKVLQVHNPKYYNALLIVLLVSHLKYAELQPNTKSDCTWAIDTCADEKTVRSGLCVGPRVCAATKPKSVSKPIKVWTTVGHCLFSHSSCQKVWEHSFSSCKGGEISTEQQEPISVTGDECGGRGGARAYSLWSQVKLNKGRRISTRKREQPPEEIRDLPLRILFRLWQVHSQPEKALHLTVNWKKYGASGSLGAGSLHFLTSNNPNKNKLWAGMSED